MNTETAENTGLTHLDPQGKARMVDVSEKDVSAREAVASGRVVMAPATQALIREGRVPKGDVMTVARLAGILAAKKTGETIPLCHPLGLDWIDVELTLEGEDAVTIQARVRTRSRTGVEMEALHAVTVAGLTVYDMCKAVDRGMILTDVRLEKKTGGRSDYTRP